MHGAKWQGDVLFCIYDHYRGDVALATLRVGGGAVLANVEWGGEYAHRVWGSLCSREQAGGAPQYKGWEGSGAGRGGGSSKAINMCMLTLAPRACAECAQDESRQNDCCCRGRAGLAVHGSHA